MGATATAETVPSSDGLPAYTGERYDPEGANALAHYDHYARYHFVLRRFGKGGSLLDVGCGLGVGTRFLAQRFERVVGVDPSGAAVEEARRRTVHPGITFEVLNDFLSPARNEQFDVVTCLEVIEHTLEQDQLVALVRERVRPGGVAVFSTPNAFYTRGAGIQNPYHVKELTESELREVLGRHFTHVRLMVQVQLNGVFIAGGERSVEGLRLEQVISAPRRDQADLSRDRVVTNFVAVCSSEPLPDVEGLLLIDPSCTYVEELHQVIRDQAKLVDDRDRALSVATAFIDERDRAIATQTALIDERDRALVDQQAIVARQSAEILQLDAKVRRLSGEAPLRYRLVDGAYSAAQAALRWARKR